jgi:hypothetical protein
MELLHSHTIDFALSTLVVAWLHFGNIPKAVKNGRLLRPMRQQQIDQ